MAAAVGAGAQQQGATLDGKGGIASGCARRVLGERVPNVDAHPSLPAAAAVHSTRPPVSASSSLASIRQSECGWRLCKVVLTPGSDTPTSAPLTDEEFTELHEP
jgi:hypothetical protein